jgi:hypothetical protein
VDLLPRRKWITLETFLFRPCDVKFSGQVHSFKDIIPICVRYPF